MNDDNGRWFVTSDERAWMGQALTVCAYVRTARDARACRATRMRLDGNSWTLIATRLNYSSGRKARLAVHNHMKREAK